MNDALKIQISAFVDGELPDNESELLLRRLSQDAVLRQQVSSYLHIGRLMRNDREFPGIESLRGRIAAALGDDVVVDEVQPDVVGSRLMTPATGVAVAATVAALALIGLSQLDSPSATDFGAAVAIDAAPTTYTEPSLNEVLSDSTSESVLEYHRRHENSSDHLARMVNFELIEEDLEGLVEIEPDSHLSPPDSSDADDEADDASAQTQE